MQENWPQQEPWMFSCSKYALPLAILSGLVYWLLATENVTLLSGNIWPDYIRHYPIRWHLLISIIPAIAVGFMIWFWLKHVGKTGQMRLGSMKETRKKRFCFAAWILGINISLVFGMILTIFAHGQHSPWGFVMEGIKSKYSGINQGKFLGFAPEYWPFFFIAGTLLGLYATHNILTWAFERRNLNS